MNVRPGVIAAIFAGVLLATAACGGGGSNGTSNTSGNRLSVVTSLPLFADFIREIGGDRVDVTALLPPGADPHTFEPAPSDVAKVESADVAYVNGLDLEPSAAKVIETNLHSGAALVEMGEQVRARVSPPPGATDNPHLWMSVDNAREYARLIVQTLTDRLPAGKDDFAANFEAYSKRLDDAAVYARGRVDTIPGANRKLVTTHDAFPYLAQYLGLQIVAFAEESPSQEASPGDIANLTTALKDHQVPAVFAEPQASGGNRVLESAASDAGVQICTLYSDSLDGTVKSYIDLVRYDADELARCLGGTPGG